MQNPLKARFGRSYALIVELALLVGMAATLLVPSSFDNILPWYEISIASYIRASFWIVGLVALPGLYAFRICGFLQSQNQTIRFALSSLLSFALVGVITMIYYTIAGSLSYLPTLLLVTTIILALASWRMKGFPHIPLPKDLSRSQTLLLAGLVATIAVALVVELNWRYLIYTDFWTSLLSGVKTVYGRDVFSAYLTTEYPVAFGYIIGGFSASAGMAIVNTQALMLPLIALNPLVFYALIRIVFALSEKVAALGAVICVLGGGLGWVFNTFVTRGTIPFIPLSGLLKDMYFFPPFWDQIAFQYKLLALLLALSSLALFALSGRPGSKHGKWWIVLVSFSALLFVWAFMIHMLPGFLAPVFIAIALFNNERRLYLRRLAALAIIGLALLLAHDLVMGGVYISLIMDKVAPLLAGLSTTRLIIYGAIAAAAVAFLVVGYYGYLYWLSRHKRQPAGPADDASEDQTGIQPRSRKFYAKILVVISLACIYLAGLLFTSMMTFTLDTTAPFPWFNYVTRYGFLGILALIGLGTSRWNSNWIKIAVFWSLLAIILGSIWWGERLNAFLFPMIALLAAVGTLNALKRAHPALIRLREKIGAKDIGTVVLAVLAVVLLVLSFGSLMLGVYWHATLDEQVSDSMAATFNWMGSNIPGNETVIIDTSVHTILFGTMHLTDHGIMDSAESFDPAGGNIFTQMGLMGADNVRWVLVNDSLPSLSGQTDLVRGLQYFGDLEYESGPFSVRSVPAFHSPSAAGDVAVIDRGYLGLSQLKNSFYWADDHMDGWTVQNGEPYEDGEVLILSWNFTSANQTGPLAYTSVPQLSGSAYPYLIIHYRNTAETTVASNTSATQILRLGMANSTNMTSIAMPISESYYLAYLRLPSNLMVNRIMLQLVNPGGLNGSLGLEVDFIGVSSTPPSYNSANPYFLSAAVPSIWPVNYSVYDGYNINGTESIVVTTYTSGVNELLAQLPNVRTVVLFNSLFFQPQWGEGWVPLASGVLSGTYEGKQFIIVGANAPQIIGDLTGFASWLYGKVG